MPRPIVTPTTEELYSGLAPVVRGDEETDWTALRFIESVGRLLDPVERLARDEGDRPGWAHTLMPDTAPVEYLEWLAQFVGVSWGTPPTEADQRLRIQTKEGQRRGRPATLLAAIQATLTGTKSVLITERYQGSAWRLYVRTYTAETPDQAATLRAILRQKPGGIVLTYEVISADSIDALPGTIDSLPGTIDDLG